MCSAFAICLLGLMAIGILQSTISPPYIENTFFAEKYGGDDCEAHPSSHPCRKGALDWAAHLGRSLNHRCRRARPRVELASAPTAWDPLAGFCPRARVRWRRRRYPFLARRRWSGWPLRGTRVGEASHPGPSLTPSLGTPLGGERAELMDLDGLAGARARSPTGDGRPAHRRRLESSGSSVRCFCPVPGCGRGDPTRATGWSSHQAMRAHFDDHCSGTLAGAVDAHSLDLCQECGLLVNKRYNGVHPRCRPQARLAALSHPRPGLFFLSPD